MAEEQDTGVRVVEVRPQLVTEGKTTTVLARTDILMAMVQVCAADGGETNLHAHTASEAFWFVLGGQATFHGEGDAVLGRLDKNQGIVIPRGTLYWFESSSSDPLVILRVAALDQTVKNERIDHGERVVRAPVVQEGAFFA